MHGRHKCRGGTGDSVERLCVGVWLAGHLATAFTLGSLLTDAHQGHAAAQRPAATQPDADLSTTDREF
jgi:hypothetical protein